ncbi:MAG: hypothetical protein M0Q93_00905 [Terrimicrobiaceae bacterium]|jgi:phospholipase/lecithinase/hemolysin|nr:hypothetical protein [Terrimicrobiaceae bacterium]
MKYAILGPQKGINRISDTEPKSVGELATVAEITDEQAAQVEAGRTATPRVLYFLIDGALKTMAEKMAAAQAARLAERATTMTPAEKIALGEQAVEAAGLTGTRLVTLMDLLLQTKEANALASKPKLVALYTWLQTVKHMAIAGSVAFPPAPHTFEEVVSE